MGPTIAAREPHVPLAPVLLTLLLCCSLPLLFIFPLFISSQISAEIRSATFTDRMAVEWLVVGHVLLTLMVVISILCGRWPIFRGTIVEKIHHFINIGAYDYFLRFAVTVFGSRARDVILSVEHYCCDQPNPALQILYLAIIGVICVLLAKSSFVYIPGHYVSGVHRYTSLLAVGVGVLLFLLTSYSDPGTIKAENVSEYLSAYPYDNIIYTEKECSTCKIPRPARSKHCHICDRCVARFDHHCGWMNNCIGEKNTRYFLAFLLWHSFLCLYGAVGLGLILAGELKEKRVIYILTVYYRIENSFYRLSPHVMQWLLASYNAQVLLMVFLAFVSFLLAGFFGYNAHLCLTNTTTNETFKWQEYISWKRKLNEAKASSAALKASICAMNGEGKPPESKWKVFFRESPLKNVVVKDNIYDQGVFRNLLEIMCPLSGRASFMPKKSK